MLWEWPAYFTKEAIEEGIDVKISTWARNAPNTTPAMAKSVANYANAQLIKMEAVADGYAEAIALDTNGQSQRRQRPERVHRAGWPHSHAADWQLGVWPALPRLVLTLATRLGFEVREQTLPREMLYLADEVFFVGTAVEVTPIKSVDRVTSRPRPPGACHGSAATAVLPDRARRRAGCARLDAVRGQRRPPLHRAAHRADRIPVAYGNDLLKIAVERGASDLHSRWGASRCCASGAG
jgi:hypothetical protein